MSSAQVTPSKTMRGHKDRVRGVVHLPGGKRIVTCSTDGSLRLWDLKSSAQIGQDWRDGGSNAGILSMALSPNGMIIASGSRDSTVSLWDVEKGKVIAKWKGHTRAVRSVCWSPGGEQVVSGGWDGTARVWNVKSGHGKPVLGLNPIETGQESVLAVSYSPKGTKIATGGVAVYSVIKIWDAKTGKLLHTVDTYTSHTVWSLAWTLDEKKLIFGLSNGSIYMLNTATWQLNSDSYYAGHHKHPVHAISVSRNGRLLVSTSSDGTARLWNLATNLQVCPPLRHKNGVKCAAFSADGKLLSTACDNRNAYVWDIQAILGAAGLEDLLSIPNAQESELKKKPLSGANATQRPPIRPTPRQVPQGFFDGVQSRDPLSPQRRRRSFAPSWGLRPRALLARLPQPFHRSQPNANEPIELQRRPEHSTSPRRRSAFVEVPALDDKKALYVAWRPKPASHNAERIKNAKWWARVVLFICCVSPSTDSDH